MQNLFQAWFTTILKCFFGTNLYINLSLHIIYNYTLMRLECKNYYVSKEFLDLYNGQTRILRQRTDPANVLYRQMNRDNLNFSIFFTVYRCL